MVVRRHGPISDSADSSFMFIVRYSSDQIAEPVDGVVSPDARRIRLRTKTPEPLSGIWAGRRLHGFAGWALAGGQAEASSFQRQNSCKHVLARGAELPGFCDGEGQSDQESCCEGGTIGC